MRGAGVGVGWSDVGCGWSGGQVSGAGMALLWHWSGHCSGNCPGPAPAPALYWPTGHNSPYMHSPQHGQCAHLVSTMVPLTPRVHHRHRVHMLPLPLPAPRARYPPWGSLLAAPVDRLPRHVTWPVKWALWHPLIGTHRPAPCVTHARANTASSVRYTLLWSTLTRSG